MDQQTEKKKAELDGRLTYWTRLYELQEYAATKKNSVHLRPWQTLTRKERERRKLRNRRFQKIARRMKNIVKLMEAK